MTGIRFEFLLNIDIMFHYYYCYFIIFIGIELRTELDLESDAIFGIMKLFELELDWMADQNPSHSNTPIKLNLNQIKVSEEIITFMI